MQIMSPEQKPQKQKRTAKQWAKYFAHRYFIEAFSGMALGLFCTLIIGTVIAQFGIIDKDNAFCRILANIGGVAKLLMGAGIGVGIAHSLKANKLTSFSAAVAGMVGANITNIFALSGVHIYGASANPSITVGDPVGAFVAAVTSIEITRHVEGKTPVDIIVVPLVAILTGTVGAIALGIPFGILFALFGKGVSMAIGWEPVSFGILIAVVMGLLLTLPTSSAAFGVMIFGSSLINTPELTHNALIGAAAACAVLRAHGGVCRRKLPRKPLGRARFAGAGHKHAANTQSRKERANTHSGSGRLGSRRSARFGGVRNNVRRHGRGHGHRRSGRRDTNFYNVHNQRTVLVVRAYSRARELYYRSRTDRVRRIRAYA